MHDCTHRVKLHTLAPLMPTSWTMCVNYVTKVRSSASRVGFSTLLITSRLTFTMNAWKRDNNFSHPKRHRWQQWVTLNGSQPSNPKGVQCEVRGILSGIPFKPSTVGIATILTHCCPSLSLSLSLFLSLSLSFSFAWSNYPAGVLFFPSDAVFTRTRCCFSAFRWCWKRRGNRTTKFILKAL